MVFLFWEARLTDIEAPQWQSLVLTAVVQLVQHSSLLSRSFGRAPNALMLSVSGFETVLELLATTHFALLLCSLAPLLAHLIAQLHL